MGCPRCLAALHEFACYAQPWNCQRTQHVRADLPDPSSRLVQQLPMEHCFPILVQSSNKQNSSGVLPPRHHSIYHHNTSLHLILWLSEGYGRIRNWKSSCSGPRGKKRLPAGWSFLVVSCCASAGDSDLTWHFRRFNSCIDMNLPKLIVGPRRSSGLGVWFGRCQDKLRAWVVPSCYLKSFQRSWDVSQDPQRHKPIQNKQHANYRHQ